MKASKVGELKAHSASLYALAPGRTSNTIFSAGADKVVAEWNLETQETNPFAIRTESVVYSLQKLNHLLAIGIGTGHINIIDTEAKAELRNLKAHEGKVFFMEKHPTENWLYSCGEDGLVCVWDIHSWDLLWKLKFSTAKIRRIAFDRNGSLAAIACGDGSVKIIETTQQRILFDLNAHQESSNSVCFLPDGNLISGGKDAYLRIWDKSNGFSLQKEIPAHNFAIYDIALSPTQKWMATVSRDKTIKIWDTKNIETPLRLDRAKSKAHLNSVNVAIWLQEEDLLATASDDRSVMLWKIED